MSRPHLTFALLLCLSLAATAVRAPARAQDPEDEIDIMPVGGRRKALLLQRPAPAAEKPAEAAASPSPAAESSNTISFTTTPDRGSSGASAPKPAAPAAPTRPEAAPARANAPSAPLAATSPSPPPASAAPAPRARVSVACAPGENWGFTPERKYATEFNQYLTGQLDPYRALAAIGKVSEEFATYAKARILMDLKLNFLAHQLFTRSFETAADPKIRAASLVCLTRVRNRMPSLPLPPYDKWKAHFIQDPEALLTLLMQDLPTEPAKMDGLRAPHSHFLKALQAHARRWAPDEVRHLKELAASRGKDPFLARFAEDLKLMLARALYADGKYAESLDAYKTIDKSSNAQVDVLNEMGWALLQANRLPQTVGLMQQLRIGALKPVFAPEPYLASAVATMKLCLYPETTNIVTMYKQDYRKAFDWLNRNQDHDNLYGEIILSLSGRSKAPLKVSLEWVRSPLFLTRQSDINQLAREEKQMQDLALKPGVAYTVVGELKKLSDEALPPFRSHLVEVINRDMRAKNLRMLGQLKQVMQSLVELENRIYIQSASDKMALVAPNKEDARTREALEEQSKQRNLKPEDVWSWGRMTASDSADAEIWEDEVGTAFRIQLVDRCKNKGKFLNLPAKRR